MKGHQARKRFGQNFLADPHYVKRIVDAVDPRPGDNLVEIGPGLAALTGDLIARAGGSRPSKSIAISRRAARAIRARATRLHEGRRAGVRFPAAWTSPARRRQPALQHQHRCSSTWPRTTRNCATCTSCCSGSRRANDRRPGHGRLRPPDRDAAGEVPDRPAVRRAGGAFRPAPKVESALARLYAVHERKPRSRRGAVRARSGGGVRAAAQDAAQRVSSLASSR